MVTARQEGVHRGAEFAYVVAAAAPDRVRTLSFCEMLIAGHERECWEFWIKAETYNPTAIPDEAIDEWIARLTAPGGLRGCLETYRAGLANARINADLAERTLDLPILTIGAPEFFGLRARTDGDTVPSQPPDRSVSGAPAPSRSGAPRSP